jgi:peptidoglycan/LPS O-acetylase OafA/YrhL
MRHGLHPGHRVSDSIMLLLLAAIHYSTSRRITEIGLLIALLGAAALAAAIVPAARRRSVPLAGGLLFLGLLLVLIAVHFGVSPFRPPGLHK